MDDLKFWQETLHHGPSKISADPCRWLNGSSESSIGDAANVLYEETPPPVPPASMLRWYIQATLEDWLDMIGLAEMICWMFDGKIFPQKD